MTGEQLGRMFEGRTLEGRYHLKRMLAAGGFGAVFHAEHRILDEPVRQIAVKITLKTHLRREDLGHVFGEALASARVYDGLEGSAVAKYLVPVYDMGILTEHDGRGFIVMGLVRGNGSTPEHCVPPKTLHDSVRNWTEPGMPPGAAMEYMRRICEAVAALHQQGVVHRDLKPNNILLSEEGQVRLVDFGLVAELGPDGYAYGAAGTHAYMAPETGLEDRSNCASDVYALGLIAYELLAGRHPFSDLQPPGNLTEQQQFIWQQREKRSTVPPPPSTYRRGIERWHDELVMRCLSGVASARPQTALELRQLIIESAAFGCGPVLTGLGWAEWFTPDIPHAWIAKTEAPPLQEFLASWGVKPRDQVWFEGATKLAVCYLSMPEIDARCLEDLLDLAEDLVRRGDVLASYEQRAEWYGGLAAVMERKGRTGLRKSRYRESAREARRHVPVSPPGPAK